MIKERVTVQDIADALGLSRTTVSKALNGAPNMPEKTVDRVLNKAKELNYKQFSYFNTYREEEPHFTKGGLQTTFLSSSILPHQSWQAWNKK